MNGPAGLPTPAPYPQCAPATQMSTDLIWEEQRFPSQYVVLFKLRHRAHRY